MCRIRRRRYDSVDSHSYHCSRAIGMSNKCRSYVQAAGFALAIAMAALAIGLSVSTIALADIGVAMDVGKVAIDQKLEKGGSYQLPSIGVRNPGSETATYRMGVSYLQDQA